jgi:basic amino acid/polyamine antiporter, APA family
MSAATTGKTTGFVRGLGLLDSTMIVAGSMIGSGIFIVSAPMSREVGAPGWLLVAWLVTGVLTVAAALSYGELAAMMPRAGGQYVYLREAFSPLWGFLYGWTFFLVIQTGTIAAVGIGFAKFLSVVWPDILRSAGLSNHVTGAWREISETSYLIEPVHLGKSGYALSLSTAQVTAVALIALLTWMNTRGLRLGKLVQNSFTITKTGALLALIVLGLWLGRNPDVVQANFGNVWRIRRGNLDDLGHGLTAVTALGIFVGICVTQTRSLFSSDAWNNVTFIAGEIRNPKRNIPLALALGTSVVIALYLLANIAYLVALPFDSTDQAATLMGYSLQDANARDPVGTALARVISPELGAYAMAVAIMISTFGCNNGLILSGARAYFAMARDGLFFRFTGRLNRFHVPAAALVVQGIWAAALVLPRTVIDKPDAVGQPVYGSLYNDLLDYVISAALIFYILTIVGIFRLRRTRPTAERPYRAFGYPVVPALYIAGAGIILGVLFWCKTKTTWPGLVIVATGFPVYFLWRKFGKPLPQEEPVAGDSNDGAFQVP